jgi:predicted membrane-bound dolichyl-phosphate-mannose-protein mannosyltransferase
MSKSIIYSIRVCETDFKTVLDTFSNGAFTVFDVNTKSTIILSHLVVIEDSNAEYEQMHDFLTKNGQIHKHEFYVRLYKSSVPFISINIFEPRFHFLSNYTIQIAKCIKEFIEEELKLQAYIIDCEDKIIE